MMRDSERAPRPSRPMMRESIVDQAAACYLALLIPTLVFKCVYVNFSFGGDWSGFDPAISSGALPLWRLYAGSLLALDYLDVFIIVGLLVGVGRFVLKVPTRYLACGGVLASFVVGGGNLLSLQQVRSLLSPAALSAAGHWGLPHPGVVRQLEAANILLLIGLAA